MIHPGLTYDSIADVKDQFCPQALFDSLALFLSFFYSRLSSSHSLSSFPLSSHLSPLNPLLFSSFIARLSHLASSPFAIATLTLQPETAPSPLYSGTRLVGPACDSGHCPADHRGFSPKKKPVPWWFIFRLSPQFLVFTFSPTSLDTCSRNHPNSFFHGSCPLLNRLPDRGGSHNFPMALSFFSGGGSASNAKYFDIR